MTKTAMTIIGIDFCKSTLPEVYDIICAVVKKQLLPLRERHRLFTAVARPSGQEVGQPFCSLSVHL